MNVIRAFLIHQIGYKNTKNFNVCNVYSSSQNVLRFNSTNSLRPRVLGAVKDEKEIVIGSPILKSRTEAKIKPINRNLNLVINDADVVKNEKKFLKTVRAFNNRNYRERKQAMLIEGTELIQMAVNAGLKFHKLFYSMEEKLNLLNNQEQLKGVNAYRISDRSLRDLRNDMHSPGILGVCEKPNVENLHFRNEIIPVTVLCSDIRDPQNLGQILTLAAATGCKKVLLLRGCVDVWDRKVLYYSNGAHFHLPIINNIEWPKVQQFLPENPILYLADSSSDVDIGVMQLHIEGKTETPEQKLLYPPNMAVPVFEQNELMLPPQDTNTLSCRLYTEIAFPKSEIVIYMGGETVGINNQAYDLARELHGQKIKLPLENEMDSLNVSVALSIILFEIKRQLTKKIKPSVM